MGLILLRAGLNEMYGASQRSLETERKLRQQLEQEVEMHRSIRQEKEVRTGHVTCVVGCDKYWVM